MPGNGPRCAVLFAAVLTAIFIGLSNVHPQEYGRSSAISKNGNAYSVPIEVTVNCAVVQSQGWSTLIQNVDQNNPDQGVSPRLWGKLIKVGFICLFLVGAGAVWLFNKLKVQ